MSEDRSTGDSVQTNEAPASQGVVLTAKAAEVVKRVISENPDLPEGTALRVGAKGGGCSGFSYVLDFDKNGKTEFDLQFESHGVQVIVEKKSEFFMSGTVIDYNDENLLSAGFSFTNPKATGTCGCGTSFQV